MPHPAFQGEIWIAGCLDLCSVWDAETPAGAVGEYRFILGRVNHWEWVAGQGQIWLSWGYIGSFERERVILRVRPLSSILQ